MPRLELWMTVFAGVAGGLAGVLWSGLVTCGLAAARTAAAAQGAQQDTVAQIVLASALRAAAGAVLGFVFWLSWGLIALVGLPWYAVGSDLRRALLAGARGAGARPRSRCAGRDRDASWPPHAVEWLFTCLAIGLLCALAWHRYA